MKKNRLFLIGFILIEVFFQGCSKGKDVAGSTQIGNPTETAAITGEVLTEKGLPQPGIKVGLYPKDFVPMGASPKRRSQDTSVVTVITDSLGKFLLSGSFVGNFNLVGQNQAGDSSLFRPLSSLQVTNLIFDVGPCTLYQAGVLTGYAVENAIEDTGTVHLYLPGSPFSAQTGDSGEVLLSGLPPGSHTFVFSSKAGDGDGLHTIISGDTAQFDPVSVEGDSLHALPHGPTEIHAFLSADSQDIIIQWRGNNPAGTVYLVHRAQTGAIHKVLINNELSQSVVGNPGFFEFMDPVANLSAGVSYYYWVRAKDPLGNLGPGNSSNPVLAH